MDDRETIRRRAEDAVRAALDDTRVVVVHGPRQAGKSTLASHIVGTTPGSLARSLDDPAALAAARVDPVAFVDHDGLLLIDEIQHEPELLLPIKASVDRDPRPGRFLLTGSARLLSLRRLPDSLAGRMEIVSLWPFSQGEIELEPDGFVRWALAGAPGGQIREGLDAPSGYAERIVRGGFPESVRREGNRRRRFLRSYVESVVDRDVVDLSDIERVAHLRRLVRVLAARTAQPASIDSIARDVELSPTTVRRHVDLLEQVFLIRRVQAWRGNAGKRATSRAKLVMTDSGAACAVLGIDADRAIGVERTAGQLVETFVIGELQRQASFESDDVEVLHFRDRDRHEVDAVLLALDGTVAGIEVKSTSTPKWEHFRGLQHLRQQAGTNFACGIVLHTGTAALSFGDRYWALPIDALWRTGA